MKKFISVLLVLFICIAPVSVYATSAEDATMVMMGDANNDKKVNAADARIVLRVASRLEKADKVSVYNADATGDGKINASDARQILRVSANLTRFTYGFDGNGTPCAINVLKNNHYQIDIAYKDEYSDDSITISFAKKGEDVYMTSKDMGFDMGSSSFSDCGMMINSDKLYALLGGKSGNIAMLIPESMCEEMGMDKSEITELADMITSIIPDNIGTATPKTINNETVYQYTYSIEDHVCSLSVASNGQLIDITYTDDTTPLVSFDKINYDNVESLFNLDNYDLL